MLLFSYVDCGTASMYSLPMPMLLPFSKPLLCYFPLVCWAAPACRAYCTNAQSRLVCTVPDYASLLCSAPIFLAPPQSHFLGLNLPVFFFSNHAHLAG